jgi:uncharacterized membrane protein
LSTGLQVTVLVVAPVVFLGLSLYLSSKEQHAYFGKIAALVCYASFVLNLSMLGQIFNITPSSNAFLIWAFMGGVLAYACNARLLLFFAIASLSCFIAMRLGAWNGVYWIDFGDRPENFFLPALICFGIPIFVRHHNYFGFAVVYRVCAMLMLFLPILILSFSGGMSYLTWEADIIEGLYQVIGIIFAGVFIWFGIKYRWTDLMYTGNTFFVLFLYTKMFTWWWDWMPKYAFFFVLGLVALLLLVVMKRLKFSAKHAGGSQ